MRLASIFRVLLHRLQRAFSHVFTTLNAEFVIHYRESIGVLRNSPDRTRFNQRANMVVGTYILIYLYHSPDLQTNQLPLESVWVLREGYCPNQGVFPFCNHYADRQAVYEAGSVETLIKIVDENGGYAIIPELHVPLLRKCQQANVRVLTNPEPMREIAFVIHRNFVRERLLNIFADAIKAIIPIEMVNNRLKKFPITL